MIVFTLLVVRILLHDANARNACKFSARHANSGAIFSSLAQGLLIFWMLSFFLG